jgi:anti-sigma factor RsiW
MEVLQLISAYADGELDPRRRADAEQHLRTCPNCARALENLSALKAAVGQESLFHRTPDSLHSAILQMVDEAANEPTAAPPHTRQWRWAAGVIATVVLIGIGIGAYSLMTPLKQKRLATDAVWDHKRSLLADHLVDVASSDPKKVSGWLSGKLGFAPWVPDQPPAGYLLLGARVDILDGREVAALVYRGDGHVINVFEWPPSPGAAAVQLNYQIQGFSVELWNNPAWNFCTVSDAGAASVQSLTNMFVIEGCSTTGR